MLKSNNDPTYRYKVIIEKPTYAGDEMHSKCGCTKDTRNHKESLMICIYLQAVDRSGLYRLYYCRKIIGHISSF